MRRTHEKVTLSPSSDQSRALDDAACATPGGAADAVQSALRKLQGRWKLTIVFCLFGAPVLRFSELQRSIEGISQKMLTTHLRALERDGVVRRTAHTTVPPQVDYTLTGAGLALRPILQLLRDWSATSEAP